MSTYAPDCETGCTATHSELECANCGQELMCERTYRIECDGINGPCPPDYLCELCAESHDSSCEECSENA